MCVKCERTRVRFNEVGIVTAKTISDGWGPWRPQDMLPRLQEKRNNNKTKDRPRLPVHYGPPFCACYSESFYFTANTDRLQTTFRAFQLDMFSLVSWSGHLCMSNPVSYQLLIYEYIWIYIGNVMDHGLTHVHHTVVDHVHHIVILQWYLDKSGCTKQTNLTSEMCLYVLLV